MDISHLLNKTTTVLRNTPPSSGNSGRFADNYTPHLPNEPVRVFISASLDRATMKLEGEQDRFYAAPVAYFLPGKDIRPEDKFTVDGRTFRVVALLMASDEIYTKVTLEELQAASA